VLRRVFLVRTEVLEEGSASIITVTRTGEIGTKLAVPSNIVFLRSVRLLLVTANVVPISPILVTLVMEALGSSGT
jgi:multidrug efflux pump subunit AcrB